MSKCCGSLARFAHRGVLAPLPGLVLFPAVTGAGTGLGRDCVSANQNHFTKMGCDIQCQGMGTITNHHQRMNTYETQSNRNREGQWHGVRKSFVQVCLAVMLDWCCCCSKQKREIPTLKTEGVKASPAQGINTSSGYWSGTQAQPLSAHLVSESEHLLLRWATTPTKRHMNLSLDLPGLHHTFGAEQNTPYLTVHVTYKLSGLFSKIQSERSNALPLQLQAAIALRLPQTVCCRLAVQDMATCSLFRAFCACVLCVPICLWCAHLQFVQDIYGFIFSSLFCTTFGVSDP